MDAYVPEEELITICKDDGNWHPDPRQHECFKKNNTSAVTTPDMEIETVTALDNKLNGKWYSYYVPHQKLTITILLKVPILSERVKVTILLSLAVYRLAYISCLSITLYMCAPF